VPSATFRHGRGIGDISQNANLAINASVPRTFFDAHGVDYETAATNEFMLAADVAQRARKITVRIECWSERDKSAPQVVLRLDNVTSDRHQDLITRTIDWHRERIST
jgi:hypothetical protein